MIRLSIIFIRTMNRAVRYNKAKYEILGSAVTLKDQMKIHLKE